MLKPILLKALEKRGIDPARLWGVLQKAEALGTIDFENESDKQNFGSFVWTLFRELEDDGFRQSPIMKVE